MRILVTGAAGFIGSHLLQRLVALDYPVTAIGSRSGRRPPPWLAHPAIAWRFVDVCDIDALCDVFGGHDAVVHLAGCYPLFGIPPDPVAYVTGNTVTTAAVLAACQRSGIQRLVLASSAQVYGRPDRLPIDEHHPLNGATAYAASKLGAEALVRAYAVSHGVETLSLRLFNVYGPRQPASNVIGTIATQALGEGRVYIHSDRPQRDFVYVGDVVEAVIAALSSPSADGRVVNIASGVAVSVGDIARRILAHVGRAPNFDILNPTAPSSPVDPDCVCADIAEAGRVLGWRPATSLDDGLTLTLAWMRRHPDGET